MTEYPALPKRIRGAAGSIAVRLLKRVRGDEGDACWGTWDQSTRTIRIEKGVPRQHQFRTLYHELAHATLDDAGIGYLLTNEGTEAICEAFASSRMQELRGQLGIRD